MQKLGTALFEVARGQGFAFFLVVVAYLVVERRRNQAPALRVERRIEEGVEVVVREFICDHRRLHAQRDHHRGDRASRSAGDAAQVRKHALLFEDFERTQVRKAFAATAFEREVADFRQGEPGHLGAGA